MLVTLILRFIHFVGLSLGKNTSGTIPRNQQDLLITKPAPVIEYDPDFYIPIMGIRNRILPRRLMKSPKSCLSFHEEPKSHPVCSELSGCTGRLLGSCLF